MATAPKLVMTHDVHDAGLLPVAAHNSTTGPEGRGIEEVSETLGEIEAVGIVFRLDGAKVCILFPEPQQREELAGQVAFLRAHRDEEAEFLRKRAAIPPIPPGVRLLGWHLKEPPVAIETCALVTDPACLPAPDWSS
jgi:hypothetical protein